MVPNWPMAASTRVHSAADQAFFLGYFPNLCITIITLWLLAHETWELGSAFLAHDHLIRQSSFVGFPIWEEDCWAVNRAAIILGIL